MNTALTIPKSEARVAARLHVRGQVQGVGFRPYIYRLAVAHRLAGRVANEFDGVRIEMEGFEEDLAHFHQQMLCCLPQGARIDSLSWEMVTPAGYQSFAIQRNSEAGPLLARVPRDRAVCAACRIEVSEFTNRRYGYAFTNCTECGPRYSILSAMPYERSETAMRLFEMCSLCDREYRSPDDRRFHAESNACYTCGPRLTLLDASGQVLADSEQVMAAVIRLLEQGRTVALKGLGGFQLITPADEIAAVARLRQRKRRPRKPFAVMVHSLEAAEKIAVLDDAQRKLLASPENPIVLVNQRASQLANNIAPGLATVGLLLPTTPLHHLILERLGRPIVATSGNRNNEPIVIDERDARMAFADIADATLIHNRPITRRLDDSVARIIGGEPVITRLGRGYAPLPLAQIEEIARPAALPPIVATGAHLKSALAVWTGSQAILGAHIGDLDSPAIRQAFVESAHDLANFYRFQPAILACDSHPDYFTTRWAHEQNLPVIEVQHHHAHAVACMIEHHLLDREVLALSWDGTGFGPDNTIWGGEVLRVRGSQFERIASMLPFALPGGDAAIRHPNRIAFSLLTQVMDKQMLLEKKWLVRLGLGIDEARMLGSMIERRINCPFTSSIGRLFDAVAALVLSVHEATYEGEAAIAIEEIAGDSVVDSYPLPWVDCGSDIPRGDWRPMLREILSDLDRDVAASRIAAKFHNALADWGASAVSSDSLTDVVLSGGCFQNRLLAERVIASLRLTGRSVYSHQSIPPGDGGLAAGQLAVAVMRMAEKQRQERSDLPGIG